MLNKDYAQRNSDANSFRILPRMSSEKIIITPFNANAVLLYHKLKFSGINHISFQDRNELYRGKSYDGTPILPRYWNEQVIIICKDSLFEELKDSYVSHGATENDILRCSEVIINEVPDDMAAKMVNLEEFRLLSPFASQFKNVCGGVILIKRLRAKPKNSLDAIAVDVTRRCTLNCESCVNATPHIVNKVDCDFDKTWNSIKALCGATDFINRIEIMGGEPFLYKRLPELLIKFKKLENKFGSIYIVTNGTLIPSEDDLAAIKEINAGIIISNYGALSTKLNELCALLNKEQIIFYVDYRNMWYETGLFRKKAEPSVALKQRLECKNNCRNIWNETFAYCQLLSALPLFKENVHSDADTLNLSDNTSFQDITEFSNRIYSGCAFCTGWPSSNPVWNIPVAKQVNEE